MVCMLKRISILVMVLLATTAHVFGQNDDDDENENDGHLDIHMGLGFPEGEFRETAGDRAFFGVGGGIYFPLVRKLTLELGLTYHYYWMERQEEDFQKEDPQFGEYEVTSVVNSNMMPIHANLRISPLKNLNNAFYPYIEGIAGFRLFNSRTRISVDDYTQNPPPDEIENETKGAWSYGYAGGLSIKLSRVIFVDGRVEKLYGTESSYIDPETIEYNDNTQEATYEKVSSNTNLMTYSLGLRLQF